MPTVYRPEQRPTRHDTVPTRTSSPPPKREARCPLVGRPNGTRPSARAAGQWQPSVGRPSALLRSAVPPCCRKLANERQRLLLSEVHNTAPWPVALWRLALGQSCSCPHVPLQDV
jgi:hypothetical protein